MRAVDAAQPQPRGIAWRARRAQHDETGNAPLEQVGDAGDRLRGHDGIGIQHRDVTPQLQAALSPGGRDHHLLQPTHVLLQREIDAELLPRHDHDLVLLHREAGVSNHHHLQSRRNLPEQEIAQVIRAHGERGAFHAHHDPREALVRYRIFHHPEHGEGLSRVGLHA